MRDVPAATRLNPGIPADLDYVLRRALRDEPDERYMSVEALAGDIRAVLESRPVDARSGDAWYRTRKFVARRWLPIAAAVLLRNVAGTVVNGGGTVPVGIKGWGTGATGVVVRG